jgi:hypothetical protein
MEDNNGYGSLKDVLYSKRTELFENWPAVMRAGELARRLNLSVGTIYDWKYRGHLNGMPNDLFFKINRTLYIKIDALRRWTVSQFLDDLEKEAEEDCR